MVVDDEVLGAADVVVALADVDGTVDDSMVVLVAVLNVTVLDVVAATSAAVELGVAAEDGPHAASPMNAIAENKNPNRHRLTPSVNP